MNKKRKILTMLALCAFSLIIFFHYFEFNPYPRFGVGGSWHGGHYVRGDIEPLIENVQMALFVLSVIYTGVFFLFAGKDPERPPRAPRKWRAILSTIIWVLLGCGLMGLGVGGIVSDNQYQKQEEQKRKAYIESQQQLARARIEYDKKHRVQITQIDLFDLALFPLGPSYRALNSWGLTGKIRNKSAEWIDSIAIIVTVRDKKSHEIVGEKILTIPLHVPPGQVRAIGGSFDLSDSPVTQYTWEYAISSIRNT